MSDKKEVTHKGWFWCHIRKDYFRWEEAMEFWRTHDWDGNPKNDDQAK